MGSRSQKNGNRNLSGWRGKKKTKYDLVVGRDSYIYEEKYQQALRAAKGRFDEMHDLREQISTLNELLDKEVIVDAELGRTYSKILGLYTDQGKELKKQIDALREREAEAERLWSEATDYIQKNGRYKQGITKSGI